MSNHINIILCPEWQQRGFAHSIQSSWFNGKASIFGLRFLQNNFVLLNKFITDNDVKTANIVFFNSIY